MSAIEQSSPANDTVTPLVHAAAPPVLLVVNSDPGESLDASIRVTHWTADDVPNFVGYRVLLLEVPPDPVTFDAYRDDVRQAELAGATITWIVTKESSVTLLAAITTAEVSRFRTPAEGVLSEVTDRRFATLFAANPALHFAFVASKSFLPAAFLGNDQLTTALVRERGGGGRILVLPAPHRAQDYGIYATLVSGLTTKDSPAKLHTRALIVGLTVSLIFAAVFASIRYYQRDFNRNYVSDEPPGYVSISDSPNIAMLIFLDGDFSNALIEKLIDHPDRTLLEPADDLNALRFFERFGLYGKAKLYFERMLQMRPRDGDFAATADIYADLIYEDISSSLDGHSYEHARFQAQKYLNVIGTLPPSKQIVGASYQLDAARKTVELVERNFLYSDPSLVDNAAALIHGDYELDVEAQDEHNVHPSLRDNAAYVYIAVTTQNDEPGDRQHAWKQFSAEHPHSELADEAAFNEIVITMNSGGEEIAMNRDAIAMCDVFVARFPKSPLADDALYYKMRMAATLADKEVLWSAVERLSALPDSDSLRRMQYEISCLWDRAPSEDGKVLSRFIVAHARRTAAGWKGPLRGGTVDAEALAAIDRILGGASALFARDPAVACALLLATKYRG